MSFWECYHSAGQPENIMPPAADRAMAFNFNLYPPPPTNTHTHIHIQEPRRKETNLLCHWPSSWEHLLGLHQPCCLQWSSLEPPWGPLIGPGRCYGAPSSSDWGQWLYRTNKEYWLKRGFIDIRYKIWCKYTLPIFSHLHNKASMHTRFSELW